MEESPALPRICAQRTQRRLPTASTFTEIGFLASGPMIQRLIHHAERVNSLPGKDQVLGDGM